MHDQMSFYYPTKRMRGSTDNVGIVNVTWNIDGPGDPEELEGAEVEYMFGKPGMYTVTLRVVDAERNTGEMVFEVVVNKADDGIPGGDVPGNGGNNGKGNETGEGGGSGVLVWVIVAICVVAAVVVGAIIIAVVVLKNGGKGR